jgi:hypothetical protein
MAEEKFNEDFNEAKARLTVKADKVGDMTMEQLQKLVGLLVLLQDSDRLLNLLACTREIFRQADNSMSQGKGMAVLKDIDNWWN